KRQSAWKFSFRTAMGHPVARFQGDKVLFNPPHGPQARSPALPRLSKRHLHGGIKRISEACYALRNCQLPAAAVSTHSAPSSGCPSARARRRYQSTIATSEKTNITVEM